MLCAVQLALVNALHAFGSATTHGRVHSPEMHSRPSPQLPLPVPLHQRKKWDSPPIRGVPRVAPPQPEEAMKVPAAVRPSTPSAIRRRERESAEQEDFAI